MDATQIILIVFIVLLIVVYPIMMYSKNKKEKQRMAEQTNSLKRGDKVLTTSGVYGTIVDLQLEQDKKIVTIETGTDKKKGYISVDAYAIYQIFRDEPVQTEEAQTQTTTTSQTEDIVLAKNQNKKDKKTSENAESNDDKIGEVKTDEKPSEN